MGLSLLYLSVATVTNVEFLAPQLVVPDSEYFHLGNISPWSLGGQFVTDFTALN